jgi:hypothetical protein
MAGWITNIFEDSACLQASWSPDCKWIVVAGTDNDELGLFKLPADGGAPVRIATGQFLDPVWLHEET